MHSKRSHTNTYSSWAVPHMGLAKYCAQPERKFLEYYNYFFILQRKNWLAISRGNQYWPPSSDTRSRIKKRRCYIHTNARVHTHTQPLLHSETKQHILQTPLPTITLPPNPRLSCLIWLTTIVERQSPFPSVFKMAVGTALVLTAVWELRDNELNCMKLSEA